MTIKKAVIAVAGLGTRFLPATKVVPKELLPIVDKPVVQYLVEEAVASGIEDVILVTRPGTFGIAEHFDHSGQLEQLVGDRPARKKLVALNSIREAANFAVVHQGQHLPYGNGSPLLAAKSFLSHDEPFVYMFGDDMVLSDVPCVKQLVDTFEKYQPGGVVAVQNVPREETSRYGIVELKPGSDPPEMKAVVEKPAPESAPSTLAQFGRFVLSGKVVDILEDLELGKDNELWLADAIDKLSQDQRVLVKEIKGTWYTTGDPLRFLITCIEYGLRHPEIGAELATYLRNVNPAGR